MTDIDALVNRLLQHRDEIFKSVEQESIDVYKYLMAAYPTRVDDNVFRFVYRSFYGLDNAGLREECKREYFELLKKRETSLENVLKALHAHKTRRGINTYQFSFATKLLHTINKKLPIYDKNIAKIIKFPPRKPRLDWCTEAWDLLKREHAALLNDEHVKKRIIEFKEHYDAKSISNAKALDFMLWALGEPTKN